MIKMNISARRRVSAAFAGVALLILVVIAASPAISEIKLLTGQTIYVPAYSHIYHGDREVPFYLTVTLSIRNTDPDHPITIVAVDYYDTEGKLLTAYLKEKMKLKAMTSTRFVVSESDKTGGSGANFVVKWQSDAKVSEPIVETIMISTSTQQGISFTSRGQAIRESL